MNYFYLLVILGIFASSCSQLLLKKSASLTPIPSPEGEGRKSFMKGMIRSVLNWRVILAYCIFFCSVVINITAFGHGVMLKDMPALESLSAIFVPVLSFFVLKEEMSKRKILACAIVLVGIFVFYS